MSKQEQNEGGKNEMSERINMRVNEMRVRMVEQSLTIPSMVNMSHPIDR